MATRLYGVLWKWHFAIGLLACPLVAVIALTGAIYTFEPELNRAAAPELYTVEPAGEPRPVDELSALVAPQCAHDVFIPGPTDRAYVFYCRKPEKALFVDPYRAKILGDGAGSAMRKVIDVAFGLHWELLLGERGRLLIEWATSWTVLLLISGAALWWPRGKRKLGGVLYPRSGLKGRQLLRDVHAVLGAYALPVVLTLAATGLMWTIHAGDERWNKVAAEPEHAPPKSKPVPGAKRIGIDRALAAARLDPFREPRAIYINVPPADEPEAVYGFYAHDDTHESPSQIEGIAIDAYAGAELHRDGWHNKQTILQKIDGARYSIHVGAILGLPGRIAACVASLILAALCITGPWMWWKRRPAKKLGIPPAARAPWPLYVLLAVFGWLLPTVGVTLLAVAAIELLRLLVLRLRRPPVTPVG